MCGGIEKKTTVQTGVQKTQTQILSTNNGIWWCVGILNRICGSEDYLSKWTYCTVGNEWRLPFLYLSCLDSLDVIDRQRRK